MSVYNLSGVEISGSSSGVSGFRNTAYLYKLKNLNDQGICTDGTYIYSCDGTNVRKYNILTKENTVVTAETGFYGHGNGMAYNPSTDYLYIATMTSGSPVAVVNADTLEFVEFVVVRNGSGTEIQPSQIAYDCKSNRYIMGVDSMFYIYDSSFNYVTSFNGNHSGVHQDIETDGTYIYKCRSNVNGRGIIQVIDFSGATVKQIDVTSSELESLAYDWTGTWYANTKNSQGLYYICFLNGYEIETVEQLHKILDAYST